MAFSDWTIYKSPTTLRAYLEIVNPITGTGSLYLNNTGNGSVINRTNLIGSGARYTPGILHGKIRQTFYVTNANRSRIGFSILQNTLDITGGTSSYYGVFAKADFGGTQRRLEVVRWNTGAETSLYSSPTPLWEFNTTFTLEVEWEVQAGQVVITLNQGTAIDYTDLSLVTTVNDTSGSRLTTSVGEGPFLLKWDTFGDAYTAYFDNTEIEEVF
jgi:hypothetical protein